MECCVHEFEHTHNVDAQGNAQMIIAEVGLCQHCDDLRNGKKLKPSK